MKKERSALTEISVSEMIKFAYFTANFPPYSITKCFEDEGDMMLDHILKKLHPSEGYSFITCGDFMRFFFDLDRTHQEKLCRWIINNYNI
jgi:hypothetical protein